MELNTKVKFLKEDTIVNGFPKAQSGTLIFFAKEKLTFVYYGDGEWKSIMSNDFCAYKEKEKEKGIVW